MKRSLRRGMKVTWSVNLSTVGGVSVLSQNGTCLSVFLETTKFTKKDLWGQGQPALQVGLLGIFDDL